MCGSGSMLRQSGCSFAVNILPVVAQGGQCGGDGLADPLVPMPLAARHRADRRYLTVSKS